MSRPTVAELNVMSHAEFKRRYLTRIWMMPEDTWNRNPLPPMDDEEINITRPSDLRYIKTWEI